ncbi:MAG: signal peptide peptidase SppA [Candidatus Kapabacteria bacterium]|nr:signal peptide peptidase SppA [Candidatus Kapabacteria bacterium]
MPENIPSQQSSQNPPPFPPNFNMPKKRSRWWIPVAIIFGVIAFIVVCFIALFAYIGTNLNMDSEPVEVKNNSVLLLNYSESLEEDAKPESIFNNNTKSSLLDILLAIKRAKVDDRIKGIYIKPMGKMGMAKAMEINESLNDFKKSGKFIYSFIEVGDELSYFNAIQSDSIFMPTEGMLELNGFSTTPFFLKKAFKNIGVEFHTIQFEDYKSAAEMFNSDKMSDSARYEYRLLLMQRHNSFVKEVSKARKISEKDLTTILNRGLYSADSIFGNKLIDRLISENELKENLKIRLFGKNATSKDHVKFIKPVDYLKSSFKSKDKKAPEDKQIAIIFASGSISSGKANSPFEDGIKSGSFVKDLREAKEDKDVKAIIIRIDSPGGSVIASDEMWEEIMKTRKVKPVYASMSDVAASGGYYMAMACDTIIAHPNTITGSIGVILAVPNFSGLLGKVGVGIDTVSTSSAAQFMNTGIAFSDKDKSQLYKIAEGIYKRFVSRVAESRGKTFAETRAIAKGRVWTGEEGFKIGIVDKLGGLQTAIDLAKARLGISKETKAYIQTWPKKEDGIKSILRQFGIDKSGDESSSKTNVAKLLGLDPFSLATSWNALPASMQAQIKYTASLMDISQREKVMVAMPNILEIR